MKDFVEVLPREPTRIKPMKRMQSTCDRCQKKLGDFGWLDVTIRETDGYGFTFTDNHQFCNTDCLADWAAPGKFRRWMKDTLNIGIDPA